MELLERIEKKVKKLGLTDAELQRVLSSLSKPDKPRNKKHNIKVKSRKKSFEFGIISDLHIGSSKYRPDVLRYAGETFKSKGIKVVLSAGDTIEGMSNREGHIYELDTANGLGYAAQLKYFTQEFKRCFEGIKVYSIEADNSHSGWINNKGNMGFDIGSYMDGMSEEYHFLGYDSADILMNGVKIRLIHPGGGTAYAISYKAQKYVGSIGFKDIPDTIIQGHYHKAAYYVLSGINFIDAGCLQDQTLFMQKMGTPAMVGYWVCRVSKIGEKLETTITHYGGF